MHERDVQEAFSAERLLVYEVSQGWEPLCRFLGVNVPEVPFPSQPRRADVGYRPSRLFPDHSAAAILTVLSPRTDNA